jgi:glucosyl-3-phosphoglycerate synthase
VVRTFDARHYALDDLRASKGGHRISVCIPALDEGRTVGAIVGRTRDALSGLVDEVLVVDDHSTDDTAGAASAAGARVVRSAGHGKGAALWTATSAAVGDVLVFCDADLRDFDPRYIMGLLGPLLAHDDIALVKAFYERTLDGQPRGGGRVTELVARPALALLFPELSPILQPLAGEYASRRAVLEQLPFAEGYGVDIGLLIDVASRHGTGAVAQVDLGVRVHRNRPLHELRPMALTVLQTMLRRANMPLDEGILPDELPPLMRRP